MHCLPHGVHAQAAACRQHSGPSEPGPICQRSPDTARRPARSPARLYASHAASHATHPSLRQRSDARLPPAGCATCKHPSGRKARIPVHGPRKPCASCPFQPAPQAGLRSQGAGEAGCTARPEAACECEFHTRTLDRQVDKVCAALCTMGCHRGLCATVSECATPPPHAGPACGQGVQCSGCLPLARSHVLSSGWWTLGRDGRWPVLESHSPWLVQRAVVPGDAPISSCGCAPV